MTVLPTHIMTNDHCMGQIHDVHGLNRKALFTVLYHLLAVKWSDTQLDLNSSSLRCSRMHDLSMSLRAYSEVV